MYSLVPVVNPLLHIVDLASFVLRSNHLSRFFLHQRLISTPCTSSGKIGNLVLHIPAAALQSTMIRTAQNVDANTHAHRNACSIFFGGGEGGEVVFKIGGLNRKYGLIVIL